MVTALGWLVSANSIAAGGIGTLAVGAMLASSGDPETFLLWVALFAFPAALAAGCATRWVARSGLDRVARQGRGMPGLVLRVTGCAFAAYLVLQAVVVWPIFAMLSRMEGDPSGHSLGAFVLMGLLALGFAIALGLLPALGFAWWSCRRAVRRRRGELGLAT